jgi:hypothetical protein
VLDETKVQAVRVCVLDVSNQTHKTAGRSLCDMAAWRLFCGLLFAFLGYDYSTSEPGESHVSGIASFGLLTVDAISGKSPACTIEGNWLIYHILVAVWRGTDQKYRDSARDC